MSDAIERKLVLPGAVVQGITGVCLILIAGFDLTQPASRWLIGGIILYAIAITFAFAVQASRRREDGRADQDAAAHARRRLGCRPARRPRSRRPARRLARGGQFLTLMIVLIVILMVTKPGV